MFIKTLFKHRKKLAMLAVAAMALKSFNKAESEDEEVVKAKKILEDNGYKISKNGKVAGGMQYAQRLYKDNPQLVDQALELVRKFGKF